MNVLIRKVKKEYCKLSNIEPDKISIKKAFEKYDGEFIEKIDRIEEITNLHIVIEESGKTPITMKFPIYRENSWEKPYRFDVKRKILFGGNKITFKRYGWFNFDTNKYILSKFL